MKTKRNLLLGILLGVLFTTGLAFLFLPFLTRNESFLLGFITSTAFVICTLLPIVLLNRREGTVSPGRIAKPGRLRLFFFMLVGVWLALAGYWLNNRNEKQTLQQQLQTAQQAELIATTRNSGLLAWMSQVLGKAEEELSKNSDHTLSDATIATLAALSYSFKPYNRMEDDSVMTKEISPERGTLLLAITRMQLDSVTRRKILIQSHFAGADLKDADLRSANLGSVDLAGADLRGANLEGANLENASLSSANLWSANLRHARMMEADLKKAELSWADLSEANLQRADLQEASMISAQLRKTDLQAASLKWVDFTGAFLNDANLAGADMFRVTMRRAQLVNADLTNTNLNLANLTEANLTKANLAGSNLSGTYINDLQWLNQLTEWLVPNADSIQQTYKIVDGISLDGSLYQLKKIDE